MMFIFLSLFGCNNNTDKEQLSEPSSETLSPPGDEPSSSLFDPSLRRLTTAQYSNSIRSVFGESILLPSILEPDIPTEGLFSVGAAITAISPVGVERYEDAAYMISEQVMSESVREDIIYCTPLNNADAECAQEWIESIGLQIYRRPLTEEEINALVEITTSVGSEVDDFYLGSQYGLAALLQSPHFLYRTEHGNGESQLDPYELASKLSFFLWNSPPDLELLSAAEDDSIMTAEGLQYQVDRMTEAPQFSMGVRNIFYEIFTLYNLDNLVKDPLVFTHASTDLGPAAKEETLLSLERIIIHNDDDFRNIFTTQTTFVDRRLAALYNITAPSEFEFSEIELQEEEGRRGLLGQASILAQFSHTSSSSATLRGAFIRKSLLCQDIPPPPADVDTSIPETDASAPTLRDRIASHLEDPACASCHQLTDPIGLGLENFDGIGRWRLTENDAVIDASGELDGSPFADAWQLGAVLKNHPALGSCFSGHVFRYAMGHGIEDGSSDYHDWLTHNFEYSGWSFAQLMKTTALSDTFQQVGGVQ
jgi:hypothetical protein